MHLSDGSVNVVVEGGGNGAVVVPVEENDPGQGLPIVRTFLWLWPSGTMGWVAFIGGICLLAFGFVSSLLQLSEGPLILAALGAFIASFGCQNPMSAALDDAAGGDIDPDNWNIHPTPPMHFNDWHLDRYDYDEKSDEWRSNPLARYEQDGKKVSISKEEEEYIIHIEGEDSQRTDSAEEAEKIVRDAIKDSDSEDAQELIFSEHPRHTRFRSLYNSTPPVMTGRFLLQAISVLIIFAMFLAIPSEMGRNGLIPFILILIMVGFISVTLNYFRSKSILEAWDTVTSIVKYLDSGHNELVGQVRPADFEPLDVSSVDGYQNKSWAFNDLVAWSWSYSVHLKVKEIYYVDGERKTRYVHRREQVRSDGNIREFLLHDGSGGVVVDLPTFNDAEWGAPLWVRNQPGSKPGNPLYSPEPNETIREHRWVLHGLRIGDPVYVMARIKTKRSEEELRGMVSENATRLHHNLIAVGEDAPRRGAKIRKGTELSVLQPRSSLVEMFGPGTLLALTQLVILLLSV